MALLQAVGLAGMAIGLFLLVMGAIAKFGPVIVASPAFWPIASFLTVAGFLITVIGDRKACQ